MESKYRQPQVTFSLEYRPAKPEQKAAGKRLFQKLIGRARAVGAAGATDFKETKVGPPH